MSSSEDEALYEGMGDEELRAKLATGERSLYPSSLRPTNPMNRSVVVACGTTHVCLKNKSLFFFLGHHVVHTAHRSKPILRAVGAVDEDCGIDLYHGCFNGRKQPQRCWVIDIVGVQSNWVSIGSVPRWIIGSPEQWASYLQPNVPCFLNAT
jgi:hypothetical protein